jgi:hypothetical protein
VEPKCEPDSGKAHGRGLYHVECPTWVPHSSSCLMCRAVLKPYTKVA